MIFDRDELCRYVSHQFNNIFMHNIPDILPKYIDAAIAKTQEAFKYCKNKNFGEEKKFSQYNSVQYCVFLYWLSRAMRDIDGNGNNAEKAYYLNKVLNSVDIFYEVNMPNIFSAEHPVGSIMGRAVYGDFFFFYQGCTVGGNGSDYPIIGKSVLMYSNSKILGKAKIGNNTIISANTYIINENTPENSIVIGTSPNLIIKQYDENYILNKQKHIWAIA
ncbi:MAG: hypothetical protein PHC34_14135 [Candidatus Gastranaerophilales bacterium]|nr:hypothetical protein [Candidatus Gastranaerophilales bacterium]